MEPTSRVTKAQRARLVVAMGLLNLILATVALTAGLVAPARPSGEIAGNLGTPGPSHPVASPTASQPTATSSIGAVSEPTPSAVAPSVEPSLEPPVEPSVEPSPSAVIPTEPPVVAVIPTPTAGTTRPSQSPLVSTPRPTVRPTAHPTTHPTPNPTPTAEPVAGKVIKPRPPCPGDASRPPGHHKVAPPPARPCTPATSNGNGHGGNGLVVVLPLALGGLAATIRTRFMLSSRRLVRATGSLRRRRRGAGVHGES
jgi:hypothetical protein